MNCPTCNIPFKLKRDDEYDIYYCTGEYCLGILKWYSAVTGIYIKENWWFAAGYIITFKRDKDIFILRGPIEYSDGKEYTELYRLQKGGDSNYLIKINYMALPTNEDFDREFKVLLSKFDRYFDKLIAIE